MNKTATPAQGAYTVSDFCAAHGVSRGMLYKLWEAGKGPRAMHVGRRRLISVEAAADWRRAMEVEHAA